MTQLEIHKKIDQFFEAGIKPDSVKVAQNILELGAKVDTENYFFAKAKVTWLSWLWENGFLDNIKQSSENIEQISYRMPELEYLMRMGQEDQIVVAKIIGSVKFSEKDNNPEVINTFLWIIEELPTEQIKTLTAKIRDEEWLRLISDYNKTGYRFVKIFKRLIEDKEWAALLELSEAILAIKSEDEIPGRKNSLGMDNLFRINDVSASGVFEALANIDKNYIEKALEVAVYTMGEMVKTANKDEDGVFQYEDSFSLFDVDFFELELGGRSSISSREDIKNLAAAMKKLIERVIADKGTDEKDIRKILECINRIPFCHSIWRFRLFVLAQCPAVFREELKDAFFKLFEVENYYEIEGGAEYKKALKIGFTILSEADKKKYISEVFRYFTKKSKERSDQEWHKRTGWEILSCICSFLSEEEKIECVRVFNEKCDENYKPEPSIGRMVSGSVHPEPPDELDKYTPKQIIEKLKKEWKADALEEKYKNDSIINRRGVEGLGDALKEDIKKRKDEYLENITKIFDRENIDSHYVYSFLRGIEDMLKGSNDFSEQQIISILDLFDQIRLSGEDVRFSRDKERTWPADWIAVHMAITEVLIRILDDEKNIKPIFPKERKRIIGIIEYLFSIKESPSKEKEKPEYGDPFNVAINSVRGRNFEVFIKFVENDGNKLASDSKEIYKKVLEKDDTLAIRFMFGHFLASFYFRDKDFISGLFSKIFPKDEPDEKDLYLAAWEGYLTSDLYRELFEALQEYYKYAINFDSEKYTDRKYFKNLNEALGVHMALAFLYLGMEIGDNLFELFWNVQNAERHNEFLTFIGRSCFNKSGASDGWLAEHKISKDKLLQLWDWVLENTNIKDPKIFSGFGYWINPEREIIDDRIVIEKIAKTLNKSGGKLNWDYSFKQRLSKFAQVDAANTFLAIRNLFLDSADNLNKVQEYYFEMDKIKEALNIIYTKGDMEIKKEVADLVNTLIVKGSRPFWPLEEILK